MSKPEETWRTRADDLSDGDTRPASPSAPSGSRTDPEDPADVRRRIETDTALSPVAEQPGGASLANLGRARPTDRLFRD